MKIFNSSIVNPFSFYQEKPTAIRVYPCPACNETISAEASNCRFCGLPIDAATAQRLLLENQRVTNAVASANTFRLSLSLTLLMVLSGIMDLLTKDPRPPVLLPLIAISYGALWFYRYGSLITRDDDYSLAVKRVKRTLIVWVLAWVLPLAIATLNAREQATKHRVANQKTGVELQGTDPPVFVLSGPGSVTNFSVGILPSELREISPSRVQTIWEVIPHDIFSTEVASVGQITYGATPSGFTQYIPLGGPPVQLSPLGPGKVYVFILLTMGAPQVLGEFEMKDGKPSMVQGFPYCLAPDEKGKQTWTRCGEDKNPAK